MSSANFSTRLDSVSAWSIDKKVYQYGIHHIVRYIVTHSRESMEETCNVGHNATFIGMSGITEIFNFQELLCSER